MVLNAYSVQVHVQYMQLLVQYIQLHVVHFTHYSYVHTVSHCLYYCTVDSSLWFRLSLEAQQYIHVDIIENSLTEQLNS